MIKKIALGIISLILVGSLSACSPQTKSDKLQIATTSFALKNFIETIGGDNVEVVFSLTGNPHHFELTQADAQAISDADAFMNVEAGDYVSIGEKIKNVNPQLPTFDLATNITLIEATGHDHEEEHDEGEGSHTADELKEAMDPHVWLSPILAQILADNIEESLSTLDKGNGEVYKENATELKAKLVSLDKKFAEDLKNRQQNSILVSHAAYGYLANEYNIIQRGVTDNSDHSESTQQAIIELDEYIKVNQIKYIFVEDNIESSSTVTVLKTQHNLSELTLSNIETDATNSDYFTLMEKNLEALKKGLEVA